MRFVCTAIGLVVALTVPVCANAGQEPALAPAPWSISPQPFVQNQSWRAPPLLRTASPSPGTSAALADGFSHRLRYSLGTEWAVRAAVVALQATGHVTSGQRDTTGDIGQQAAAWHDPLWPPINIKTGSSQTAP